MNEYTTPGNMRSFREIFADIPDMKGVPIVRTRDGLHVAFAVERIAIAIDGAIKASGIADDTLVAECVYHVCIRIERMAEGNIPTTDDIAQIIALVFIENDLPNIAQQYIASRIPKPATKEPKQITGLQYVRMYSVEGEDPHSLVSWSERQLTTLGKKEGSQQVIEAPEQWSDDAVRAAKSMGGINTNDKKESGISIRQSIDRVSKTITEWGKKDGYFKTDNDAAAFQDELIGILLTQRATFEPLVWKHVGVTKKPQCAGSYIYAVQHNTHRLLALAVSESLTAQAGHETAMDLSVIHEEGNEQNGGKRNNDPVAFLRGYDALARAASKEHEKDTERSTALSIEHPHIQPFLSHYTLHDARGSGVVRIPHEYGTILDGIKKDMRRVEFDDSTLAAGDLRSVAETAEQYGAITVQYDTVANAWNTSANSGDITASTEHTAQMTTGNSAAYGAMLNLSAHCRKDGSFNDDECKATITTMVTALDIIVGNSACPTPAMTDNSIRHRYLGIGYANMGTMLSTGGIQYDSENARNTVASLTAWLTGQCYAQSIRLAKALGPCLAYARNEKPMLRVIGMHRDAANAIPGQGVSEHITRGMRQVWDEVLEEGMAHGFRNMQVTTLGNTQNMGRIMDCSAMGIEPSSVDAAIDATAYIRMMAAVQPVISGCISQMITLPNSATAEDIEHLYNEAWKMGIKRVTLRKNGKRRVSDTPERMTYHQTENPLKKTNSEVVQAPSTHAIWTQKQLPNEYASVTHTFTIGGQQGSVTVGLWNDNTPAQILLRLHKGDPAINAVLDTFSASVSLAMQYGAPLQILIDACMNTQFSPSGETSNTQIKTASSIIDYTFRWISETFPEPARTYKQIEQKEEK